MAYSNLNFTVHKCQLCQTVNKEYRYTETIEQQGLEALTSVSVQKAIIYLKQGKNQNKNN